MIDTDNLKSLMQEQRDHGHISSTDTEIDTAIAALDTSAIEASIDTIFALKTIRDANTSDSFGDLSFEDAKTRWKQPNVNFWNGTDSIWVLVDPDGRIRKLGTYVTDISEADAVIDELKLDDSYLECIDNLKTTLNA